MESSSVHEGLIEAQTLFISESLNLILAYELALGNQIIEQLAWPPHCDVLIVLARRFGKRHDAIGLRYLCLNDPQDWHTQYQTHDGRESLVCR
ncbi:hypothetical protein ACKC9G_12595 [Pokkaliibacter sp. CJK22405]|uniref:hypothetical protein n=1 Tax=Pokkaliibacter sp. CJK22405 TaxID=3384615 RepID=UPI0039855E27